MRPLSPEALHAAIRAGVIEPLLPKHERRFRHPGRKRIDDRKTLQGVLFVLYTGIQWEYLPQELGFGSGPTS